LRKASIILTVALAVFFVLNTAMHLNRGFRLRVQSMFQENIQLVGRADFGSIYRTGVKLVPEDSLVEYSWNGHFVLRGHIRPLGRGPQQIRADFNGYFSDKTEEAHLVTFNADSIYCYSCSIDGHFPATVFINYLNRDALYIYSQNYKIEDAIDIAVSLMTEGEGEYEIIDYYLKSELTL